MQKYSLSKKHLHSKPQPNNLTNHKPKENKKSKISLTLNKKHDLQIQKNQISNQLNPIHHPFNQLNTISCNPYQPLKPINTTINHYSSQLFKEITHYSPFGQSKSGSLKHLTNKLYHQQTLKMLKQAGYYIKDVQVAINKQIRGEDQPTIELTHLLQSMAILHTFKQLNIPQIPHLQINVQYKNTLKRPTIIFDMDETLLHCSEQRPNSQKYILIESNLQFSNTDLYVQIRPYAKQTLLRLSKNYQIGIFTAASKIYADYLLKIIDPNNQIFSFKLYREHCYNHFYNKSQSISIKDLRIIQNRNVNQIILIDNSPTNYLFQKQNGIPIFSYYGDQNDTQLLKLQKFIQKITNNNEFTPIIKDYFQLHKYHQYNNAKQLIQSLY